MDSEVFKNLIAIVMMLLIYAELVFSKARKAGKGAKK